MMKKVAICVVLVLAMVQLMVEPGQALTCADVDKSLIQCIPFITGGVDNPAAGCCDGIKQLKVVVVTTPDKRFACNCVKKAAAVYKNINDDAVKSLPLKCGTSVSFPISKDINCDSIP